jgi:hypothetical protein
MWGLSHRCGGVPDHISYARRQNAPNLPHRCLFKRKCTQNHVEVPFTHKPWRRMLSLPPDVAVALRTIHPVVFDRCFGTRYGRAARTPDRKECQLGFFTTVSGSFHRHMDEIAIAVESLRAHGVEVLSPSDPEVVDQIGLFLFVASDRHRSVRLVQDRHLDALCHSHFLWLVCPDGYVGQSASLEIGFAIARGIPIYSEHLPEDLTLRQYVHRVDSIADAMQFASRTGGLPDTIPSLLLDPAMAIQAAQDEMSLLGKILQPLVISKFNDPLPEVRRRQREVARLLGLDPAILRCQPDWGTRAIS